MISEKTQAKLFWILVVVAIVLIVLDFIALYNMNPMKGSTGPYNQGVKTAAVFITVPFGIGLLTTIIYFISHRNENKKVAKKRKH